MSFLIFSFITIAVSGFLIWLVFKIKSTVARVLLTILIVIVALITILIGGAIFGLSGLFGELKNTVEVKQLEDKELQRSLIPKTKENGEEKDIFDSQDIVLGNGVELEITQLYLVQENTQLEYVDNKDYCAIDIRILNTHDETQSIYNFNFDMRQSDGTMISSKGIYNSGIDLENKFGSFTVELEPNAETNKSLAFDCLAFQDPLAFEYSGGELLGFSIVTDNNEFKPITFQISKDSFQ